MNYSSSSSNGSQNNNASSVYCNGTKYVIKKGDTLYSISRKYDVPLALVLRANPYVDVYNLQIGDEICIPSKKESSTPVVVGPGPVRPPVIEGPGPVLRPERPETLGPVMKPIHQDSKGMESAKPVKPVMPAQKKSQVRQAMPVAMQKPEKQIMPIVEPRPMEQTMPKVENIQMPTSRVIPRHYMNPVEESPVMKAKIVAPVRIITQPMVANTDKEKCSRWCSYQDRERFNTIMNYDDSMKPVCKKSCPPKCTERITKPVSCSKKCQKPCEDNDTMAIVSYVSREDDTLQDILDYFTMDVKDLFMYNTPNTIRLKPGCMIQVPGRGDDM